LGPTSSNRFLNNLTLPLNAASFLLPSAQGFAQTILWFLGPGRKTRGTYLPIKANRFEIFGSECLTGALLDRLTHHIHILEMNGESYRLNESRKRRKFPKTPA
jgi:hypothetical protein